VAAALAAAKDGSPPAQVEWDYSGCEAAVEEEDPGGWPLLIVRHADSCSVFERGKTDGV
jgi:hypothetical protein